MTHLEFFRCDQCGRELENAECSARQLMYQLIGCYDGGRTFHFCSEKCLSKFINKPRSEWKNIVKKGELQYTNTVGQFVNRILEKK